MTTLRTAAQQALEALEEIADEVFSPYDNELGDAILALRAALAQQDEPVQEPVAWLYEEGADSTLHWNKPPLYGTPLYTAPPQRQPLTEEEILKAIGWERAEMYMKLTPNFPIEEARKETIKNARAIERAHGIKE
jgi:hypothetical protein